MEHTKQQAVIHGHASAFLSMCLSYPFYHRLLIHLCAPVINVIGAQLNGFTPGSCTVAFYLSRQTLAPLPPSPKTQFIYLFIYFDLNYVLAFLPVDLESAVCTPRGSLCGNGAMPQSKIRLG